MFVIPQNESVKGNSLVNEKSNALQSSSTKSIDQNATNSTNVATTDNPESSNVELQIGKTQGPRNQFVSVINKSGSKNANQILKSIPNNLKIKLKTSRKMQLFRVHLAEEMAFQLRL